MEIEYSPGFMDAWEESDLSVSSSGYVTTDATWRQMPLPSPYSRLYFVTGGSGMIISDTEQLPLEPGYVYLAPCGASCGFYGTDSVTKLFFHINFTMPNGYDLFASCKKFLRIPYSVSRTEQLSDWFRSNDTVKLALLKCSIWEVVASFASILRLADGEQGNYSESVRKAIAYIRENLAAGLTVKTVADAVFCSSGVLSQAFHQEIGVTIGQYIEDLVMQEAQWRLLESNGSIGQISSELGFCDQFYFTRRFSKRFQISPRDYRKSRAKYGI